jgi:hypothetical protein
MSSIFGNLRTKGNLNVLENADINGNTVIDGTLTAGGCGLEVSASSSYINTATTVISGGVVGYLDILEHATGPTVAYSTYRAVGAYCGPCMRLQKTTGGTPTDVSFDPSTGYLNETEFNALTGTGAMQCLIWYDQSGNGRDAAADVTNIPEVVFISNVPEVVFGGGKHFDPTWTPADVGLNTNNHSIHAIAKTTVQENDFILGGEISGAYSLNTITTGVRHFALSPNAIVDHSVTYNTGIFSAFVGGMRTG